MTKISKTLDRCSSTRSRLQTSCHQSRLQEIFNKFSQVWWVHLSPLRICSNSPCKVWCQAAQKCNLHRQASDNLIRTLWVQGNFSFNQRIHPKSTPTKAASSQIQESQLLEAALWWTTRSLQVWVVAMAGWAPCFSKSNSQRNLKGETLSRTTFCSISSIRITRVPSSQRALFSSTTNKLCKVSFNPATISVFKAKTS